MTQITCSSCQHFSQHAHPSKEGLCQKLGVREYAAAPESCYHAAPIKLVRADIDVEALGKQIRHLNVDQMHVLGELLRQAADLQAFGLKFGQPVFINLGNTEVLANYYKGYVVGMRTIITAEGPTDHVYVASNISFADSDKPEHRSLLSMLPSSLITGAKFKELKAKLIAAGMLVDKVGVSKNLPLANWLQADKPVHVSDPKLTAYEPPTLDTAPAAWLDIFDAGEMESLKADVKRRRQRIDIDANATKVREQRAASKLAVTETVAEDGTVIRTVTSKGDNEPATQPKPQITLPSPLRS